MGGEIKGDGVVSSLPVGGSLSEIKRQDKHVEA